MYEEHTGEMSPRTLKGEIKDYSELTWYLGWGVGKRGGGGKWPTGGGGPNKTDTTVTISSTDFLFF